MKTQELSLFLAMTKKTVLIFLISWHLLHQIKLKGILFIDWIIVVNMAKLMLTLHLLSIFVLVLSLGDKLRFYTSYNHTSRIDICLDVQADRGKEWAGF